MDLVVGQQIIDDAAKERNIGSRADWRIKISDSSSSRKTRINNDQFGLVVLFRLDDPLETYRMRFGGIAPHDQDDISILDVNPVVGHCTTAKRRSQTGYRRAVSDTRLFVEGDHPGRPNDLVGDVTGFIA